MFQRRLKQTRVQTLSEKRYKLLFQPNILLDYNLPNIIFDYNSNVIFAINIVVHKIVAI